MNRRPSLHRFFIALRNFFFVSGSTSEWAWPPATHRVRLVRPVIEDKVSQHF